VRVSPNLKIQNYILHSMSQDGKSIRLIDF
jgi:hypothetical protein